MSEGSGMRACDRPTSVPCATCVPGHALKTGAKTPAALHLVSQLFSVHMVLSLLNWMSHFGNVTHLVPAPAPEEPSASTNSLGSVKILPEPHCHYV